MTHPLLKINVEGTLPLGILFIYLFLGFRFFWGGGGGVESQKQFPGNCGKRREGGREGGPREEEEELGLGKTGTWSWCLREEKRRKKKQQRRRRKRKKGVAMDGVR